MQMPTNMVANCLPDLYSVTLRSYLDLNRNDAWKHIVWEIESFIRCQCSGDVRKQLFTLLCKLHAQCRHASFRLVRGKTDPATNNPCQTTASLLFQFLPIVI